MRPGWFHVNRFSIGEFVAEIIAVLGDKFIKGKGFRWRVGHRLLVFLNHMVSIAIAYWIRTSFGFHTTAIPLSLWERGWG